MDVFTFTGRRSVQGIVLVILVHLPLTGTAPAVTRSDAPGANVARNVDTISAAKDTWYTDTADVIKSSLLVPYSASVHATNTALTATSTASDAANPALPAMPTSNVDTPNTTTSAIVSASNTAVTTTSAVSVRTANTILPTTSTSSVRATNTTLPTTSTSSVRAANTILPTTSTSSVRAANTALPTTSTVSVSATQTALLTTSTDSVAGTNTALPTTSTVTVGVTNTALPITPTVSVEATNKTFSTKSKASVFATKMILPTTSTVSVDAANAGLSTSSTLRVGATNTALPNTSTFSVSVTSSALPVTPTVSISGTNTALPITPTISVGANNKKLSIKSKASVGATNTALPTTLTVSVGATKKALSTKYRAILVATNTAPPAAPTVNVGVTNKIFSATSKISVRATKMTLPTTSTASNGATNTTLLTVSTAHTVFTPKTASTDLPDRWRELCTTSETFVRWNFTTLSVDEVSGMTQIFCYVEAGQHLMLTEFRKWAVGLHHRAKMAIKVICNTNKPGAFNVPWPMKINGLVYLEVHGCNLPDYYSEYLNQSLTFVPDQLRVLDLVNCVIQTSVLEIVHMIKNLEKMLRDVECGPLSLERLAIRNLRYDIEFPDYDDNNWYEIVDYYSDILWLKYPDFNFQCNFKHLCYIDESYFQSGKHLFALQAKSFYPELKVYNLSHVGFHSTPIQLYQWRRTMEKLVYLDLSYNSISEIDFTDYGFAEDGIGTINLQFNSIKQLRKSDLDTLLRIKSATIDIRNNLIDCSCGMLQDFRGFLKTPNLGRYEYLRDLRCGWPEKYRGKRVSDLTEVQAQCTESLFIMTGVLGCLVLFLVVVVIILWRFRREVVILVYTRLHILLPCQAVDSLESKDFDAFISYSSKDDDWVLKTLVKTLESQEDGWSGFKLCVHHRDFEIGAAIADNVVRSVESSRHTVMVLSRNFVQSEWCIYEFRTAMQQSLLERRKHLILIILEEVPKSELDADLRKCLETFTYIQAGETLFWDKLRYSLSVRNRQRSTRRSSSSAAELSEKGILKSSNNNNVV